VKTGTISAMRMRFNPDHRRGSAVGARRLVLGGCAAIVAASAAVCAAVCATVYAAERSDGLGRGWSIRRLETAKGRLSPPVLVNTNVPPEQIVVVGPDFDPAAVDELSVAGDGRVTAYATLFGETGVPGATRDVVVDFESGAPKRYSDAAGENDQPAVDFDKFGYRVVWRGSDGARGTTTGNIYIAEHNSVLPTVDSEIDPTPVKLTSLTSTQGGDNFGTAFDPAIAARVRFRDAGSGIMIAERDARVAFVSTGNLDLTGDDGGRNPGHVPQVFLWLEQEERFEQITDVEDPTASTTDDPGLRVARPSISGNGDIVAFEANADLTPDAADPKDPTRIGNPGRVRQIFVWRRGVGVRQITWSTGDCRAPRLSRDGRTVLFCSKGEPIAGANPEGNYEIFQWVASGAPARRLRQITQTTAGQNVLPRPTRTPSTFAFWTTSNPGGIFSTDSQVAPRAVLVNRGRVSHVHGYSDLDNTARLLDPVTLGLVFTGPPCPGVDGRRIHFATNDWVLNAPRADDDGDGRNGGRDNAGGKLPNDRKRDASTLIFHLARAQR
jgi:hypothetical protein